MDNGGDLAENVTWFEHGLNIGYLSGLSNRKNDQNYAVQENAHIKLKEAFHV